MREAQVRQPPGMNLGPGPEAGVDPPVTEQKRLQMLALLAQVLHGRFPSPHQIANGFVSRVGNPNGRQLAGAMQSGQRERIPTIGLDALARPFRDQRGSDDGAVMPEIRDLPLQAIAGRPGLITEQQPAVLPASFVTSRRTAPGVCSMSPRNRTSPWRPSSAKATEIFNLEASRPTKTALSWCMARPLCVRLGAGPSGATLVRRIARDEPPPLRQRTYGLPDVRGPMPAIHGVVRWREARKTVRLRRERLSEKNAMRDPWIRARCLSCGNIRAMPFPLGT